MARSVPQLAQSDLDAASPHVLQVQFESVLAFSGDSDEPPENVSMPTTLLLMPGLPGASRETLRVQAQMIDGATRSTKVAASALCHVDLKGRSPESTIGDIVVLAVNESDPDDAQVQAVLDACVPPSDLARIVVLVCANPERWRGLRGVTAIVRAHGDQIARTACNAFCALSTHGASRMFTCLDLADLLMLFDGAATPFRLVSASWHVDEGRLRWHDAQSEALFRASRWIFEAIYLHPTNSRANRYSELVQSLRNAQGDHEVLMVDAPVFGFVASQDDLATVPIHALVVDNLDS